MPTVVAAVVAAITNVFVAVGISAATAATLAVATVKFAAYLAIDAVIRRVTRPDFDNNTVAANVRTENVVKGGTEPRSIVYGQTLVGGVLAYANTSGNNNSDLWYVIAHAGHEVEDITDFWFEDQQIGSNNISFGNPVTGGKFFIGGVGFVTFYKELGTSTQTVVADLDLAFGDITSAHRGRGIAYTVTKLTLTTASEKVFERGAPRNIRALVTGKNDIYDPRLDSSPGNDPTNASFQAHTNNPALITADYMRDTSVGMSISDASINWQVIFDEANFCDQTVPTLTAGIQSARFPCDGMLLTSGAHAPNIKNLLTSFNGRIGYKNGLWEIRAGRLGSGANLDDNSSFDSDITGWLVGDAGNGSIAFNIDRLEVTNSTGDALAVRGYTTVIGRAYQYKVTTILTTSPSSSFRLGKTDQSDGTSPDVTDSTTAVDSVLEIFFIATATTTFITLENTGANSTKSGFDEVELYLVATIVIDESWIRDDITLQTATRKAERMNSARGFYRSNIENYKTIEALEVTNTAFVTRDNGEVLYGNFNLPFTQNESVAQRLLHKKIQANDEQKVISLPCNYKALKISVHDKVMITIGELAFTNKIFRVLNWTLKGEDNGIDVVLREDSIAGYEDLDIADYSTRSATGIINAAVPEVPPPTSVTVTAKEGGNLIAWVNPDINPYWDMIAVFADTDSGFPGATEIYRGRADSFFHKLDNGETRFYFAQAIKGDEVSSVVSSTPTSAQAGNFLATAATTADWTGVVDDDPSGQPKPDDGASETISSDLEPNNVHEGQFWQNNISGDTVVNDGREDSFGDTRQDSFNDTRDGWGSVVKRIGSQTADRIQDSRINFEGRNDRLGTALVVPVVATDGTAVDHTVQTSGDVDISFEWAWSGSEPDIDGFIVFVRASSSSAAYNIGFTPAEETITIIRAEQRNIFLWGVPGDLHWTFGVRAYRIVDADVTVEEILFSDIAQPALAAEDPFQPTANIAFNGDITGTINGATIGDLANQDTVDFVTDVIGTEKPDNNATKNTADLLSDSFDLSVDVLGSASIIQVWDLIRDGTTPVTLLSAEQFRFDEAGTYLVTASFAVQTQNVTIDVPFEFQIEAELSTDGGSSYGSMVPSKKVIAAANHSEIRSINPSKTFTFVLNVALNDRIRFFITRSNCIGGLERLDTFLDILQLKQIVE